MRDLGSSIFFHFLGCTCVCARDDGLWLFIIILVCGTTVANKPPQLTATTTTLDLIRSNMQKASRAHLESKINGNAPRPSSPVRLSWAIERARSGHKF